MPRSPTPVVAAATLLLFLVWSNSFLAMSFLLGTEAVPARLDWLTLTTTRFAPVTLLAAAFCLGPAREEALAALRAHPVRLFLCGTLACPVYGLCLYWGMERGVPAPIASLCTSLTPFFLLAFGALFLRERLTLRKVAGFAIALAGLVAIAESRNAERAARAVPMEPAAEAAPVERVPGAPHPVLPIAVTVLAPLAWSIHTALSKPVSGSVSPLVWTALYLLMGGVPLLLALPWIGGREMLALDGPGWAALLYLGPGCTVCGFTLWSWLVRRLPASTLGLTVFLNPPLTFASKAALAALLPAVFTFSTTGLEAAGSAVVLAGVALAVVERPLRA